MNHDQSTAVPHDHRLLDKRGSTGRFTDLPPKAFSTRTKPGADVYILSTQGKEKMREPINFTCNASKMEILRHSISTSESEAKPRSEEASRFLWSTAEEQCQTVKEIYGDTSSDIIEAASILCIMATTLTPVTPQCASTDGMG